LSLLSVCLGFFFKIETFYIKKNIFDSKMKSY